jgi:hypothetical protein
MLRSAPGESGRSVTQSMRMSPIRASISSTTAGVK